jgi:hypothetical protein
MRAGDVAICGLGTVGLITQDGLQEVTYRDNTKGEAYVGIHLTNKIAPIGSPWSSRTPVALGHIDQFIPEPNVVESETAIQKLRRLAAKVA